ncbi:spindle assembly checkpoint kinase [Pichia californica]|uniref:Aurora kinase n=1 Tax=Pichia californica TaxID=460514 RepID=A0A9P7BF97_9ASCO|nr:spindle assembly checkpoint kinase [[Candida] californica]
MQDKIQVKRSINRSKETRELHEMDVFHRLSMPRRKSTNIGGNNGNNGNNSKPRQWKLTDFEIGKRLGKGKFGKVYCVREKKSGFICALKVMSKQEILSYHIEKQIIREIEIQSNILHENCLALYGWFQDDQNVYLILEYAAYGELYKILTKMKRIDDKLASYYIYQVAMALKHLHEKHLIHRDLKPENILIHLNQKIKLADFGWSSYINNNYNHNQGGRDGSGVSSGNNDINSSNNHTSNRRTTMCGTLDYLPPEMVEAKQHDEHVDVWALGVLLYELLVGHPPFEEKHAGDTYKRIARVDFSIPSYVDEDARDLVERLLVYDPQQRLALQDLEVYSKTDSHRQVLDTAKLILSKDNSNVQALKRSLVALINMDNYHDAMKLIQQYSHLVESNKHILLLELAYIYYKLDSTIEDDLIKLSNFTNPKNSRAFNHILAQYYYRIGEDFKALEIYKLLIKEQSIDESENLDISVNERAVISQLKFQNNFNYELNKIINPISSNYNDSYDQLFNDSLILIVDKKYNDAINLLNKTYNLAENSLSDYESSEKFVELAPIKLQLAYVNILLSNFEEANNLLNDLQNQLKSFSSIDDINVKILTLLIQINKLVCIQNLESIENIEAPLLYRELNFNDTIELSKQRLTIPQLSIIERNHLLLGFFSGKKSKNQIKSFNSKFPSSLLPNAFNFNNDINKDYLLTNKKYFYNLSIKNPSNISLALLSSQIAINSNNYQRSISILENLINNDENVLLLPSIGKLLYTLYESLDCKNLINKLLIKIANLLIKKTNIFNNEDIKYSKFISLKLISTNELLSKELLTKINELEILNVKYSNNDIDNLVSNIDITTLISNGINPLIKTPINTIVNTGKITKEKRKRSKPKKLPKDNSNSLQQIDSERWLPMKDRTYYKMKKSKKNKNTQGGAIDAATEKALNINSTPEPVLSSNNNNSNSSKKNNNKKKKGKK